MLLNLSKSENFKKTKTQQLWCLKILGFFFSPRVLFYEYLNPYFSLGQGTTTKDTVLWKPMHS